MKQNNYESVLNIFYGKILQTLSTGTVSLTHYSTATSPTEVHVLFIASSVTACTV